jgi:DNA-binding NarL/FixJ family response regulator
MPGLDGVAATRKVCQAGERPRVLILTTFDLDEYAFAALRAGASGFLLKSAPPEELLYAIRSVHNGDSVVAPSTTRRLIGRFLPHLPAAGAPAGEGLADLIYFHQAEKGGHFAAWEQPQLFSEELRAAFRALR